MREPLKEQSVFVAALAIEAVPERSAFLAKTCEGDPQLHERIMSLLAAYAKSDKFIPDNASQLLVADEAEAQELAASAKAGLGEVVGQKVGRYKLLKQLGEGGCGAVYLAEQDRPVQRLVALKIIKFGMDTKSVIARFETERQALALMDHPNIARVLDAGATETGRPYFVMELVQGVKITSFCDENHLQPRQRLDLFVQVCHAIQHAHQKGVIHRDIKPSNILIALHDGVPLPKVIDFGIAKAISSRLAHDTALTLQGQFVGTPAYMSPEQAEIGGLDVDTRSDIYSLGVLLYELLAGRPPFNQQELVSSGLDRMRKILREADPLRPSALLTSLSNKDLTVTARLRQEEPTKLIRSLKGDLDWIVMKALEKDRQRRYDTVNALSMDVRRYLGNIPVVARPPTPYYRLKKLIQRNKVVFASGTAVVLSLIVGFGVSTRLFFKEHQARLAETQLRKQVEARERVTQAGVLIKHDEMEKADDLVDSIPLELLTPSTEARSVFSQLGNWNILQENWRRAADRFLVLVHVEYVDESDQTQAATYDMLTAAPLLVEAGNIEGYKQIRGLALSRLEGTTSATAAEQLIKIALLLPADDKTIGRVQPYADVVSNSIADDRLSPGPNQVIASWRTLALSLWEYRRGDYGESLKWLEQCSSYPDRSTSCDAGMHIIRSMTLCRQGQVEKAESELKQGREMVDEYFRKELKKMGTRKTGDRAGWLVNRVFLHEAEGVFDFSTNFDTSTN